MSARAISATLVAVILTLGAVLLAVRHFLAADLAALLGGLAIFAAVAAAGAVCLYNHCDWLDNREQLPTTDQVRDWIRGDPVYREAVLRGLIASDLAAGLWIGVTSDHPLVTAPAYCLTLLAFKGLLGAVSRRLPPILWIRAGIIVSAVLLGLALQPMVR
ncbi:MAG: hypothetical protein ACO1SX_00090 [Actinomycetota bacterium]